MESLYALLALPVVIGIIAKLILKDKYQWPVMGIATVVCMILAVVFWASGRHSLTHDVEVWNGKVTSKTKDKVGCRHSYSCNCVTSCSGSGKNQSCSTICQTCYDHPFDIDWNLHTTLGGIGIDKIDRQGLGEPPRWTRAQVGDPVADTRPFTNYVKAVPESLFNAADMATTGAPIPEYPKSLYDYHYIDRVLAGGVAVPDLKEWNRDLAMALRDLGASKQVNYIVVFTKSDNPNYANALNHAWLGGKKNDVIVVLGTPNYPEISWVKVLSWTDKQDFKIVLRDAIFDLKTVDRTKIIEAMMTETKQRFVRKKMADFEYLKNEIHPPDWAIIASVIITLLISILTPLIASGAIGGFKTTKRRF